MADYDIAAARAAIAASWHSTIAETRRRLGRAAHDPRTGWGAALDALEAAQEHSNRFRRMFLSQGEEAAKATARADAAEAEVARLKLQVENLERTISGVSITAPSIVAL